MIVGRKQREKLSLVFEFFHAMLLFGIHLALLFSTIFDYCFAQSSLPECSVQLKRFTRRSGKSLWFFARVSLSKWKLKLFSLSEWNGTFFIFVYSDKPSNLNGDSETLTREPPPKTSLVSNCGVFLHELSPEILVQICQYLTVPESVRGIGLVCKRFHSVIQCSGEIWKTLQTDVEFSMESFQSTIVKHAKHFQHLGLRCSQKRVHYNNLDLYIENTLGLYIIILVSI